VIVPVESAELLTDAVPVLLSVAVTTEPPGKTNVTVPVGMPVAGATAFTCAVRVTGCPVTEGFGVEVNVVTVAPWFTVCVPEAVLAENPMSPLYVAVMVPVESAVLLTDAVPVLSRDAVTTEPPGKTNVTVPVGMPAAGATAFTCAVTVTSSPVTEGFGAEVNVVTVAPWFTV
jgi:hypothetical protein